MKKKILLFALLVACDVKAANYTEYEFAGYEKTIPIVDEFTKYEPLTLHKFYSLKETSPVYVTETDPLYIDDETCQLYEKKKIVTTEDGEHRQTVRLYRAMTPYETTTIRIGDIDFDIIAIKKIELKLHGLDYTVDLDKIVDRDKDYMTVDIPKTSIADIEFTIYYEAKEFTRLTITLEGGDRFSKISVLEAFDNQKNSCKFIIYDEERYQEFIKKYGLSPEKYSTFYTYEENIYECIKKEKVYFTTSKEEVLEGYTYDVEDDEMIYKIYKREKIDDFIHQEVKPVNSHTTLSTTTSGNRVANAFEKVDQGKIATSEEDRDFKEIAIAQPDDEKTETEECEACVCDEKKLKNQDRIKILLIIAILLTIIELIYSICVKKMN